VACWQRACVLKVDRLALCLQHCAVHARDLCMHRLAIIKAHTCWHVMYVAWNGWEWNGSQWLFAAAAVCGPLQFRLAVQRTELGSGSLAVPSFFV
jgi:hypothetical protein